MFKNYNYDPKSQKNSFDIQNMDLSIVNGIRRVLLTEIPIVGFYGEDEPSIEVHKNTGPLHNEFMKHRIGLIPINVTEKITDTYEDNDYSFDLNIMNDGATTVNVTTASFTGTYKDNQLTAKELNELFPPNPITKQNILITRLRAGEHLHFTATAIKRTGKTNASFSPVSLANFYFIEEPKEASKASNILDKHRAYHKNEYGDPTLIKFEIETVNKLSYSYLFSKAIEIIIAKLNKLITNIDNITIEPVPNNPFSVNFHVDNEDDTLGNIIQSIVHNKYIRGNEKFNKIVCSYIGYICPHPLKQLMIIRITLEEQTNPDVFKQFLTENCEAIIKELNLIDDAWIKFNSQKNKKAT
jgi:DNA-directed RNA polymerase subunit L|uniref:DNA-directed RNA polymerase RpoA/D/Rpb3-type domain-containing protein n=1 Tax=viral metagenome TaxID=1070528 RepID=A0A6C0LGJ0_9ZZZZ